MEIDLIWALIICISVTVGIILGYFGIKAALESVKKTDYYAVTLREVDESYHVITDTKIKKTDTIHKVKDKAFKLDFKKAAYRKQNRLVQFFDYDTGEQLSFKTYDNAGGMSPEELDALVNSGILQKILNFLSQGNMPLLLTIMALVAGLAIGIVIGIIIPIGNTVVQITPTPTPLPVI